MKSCVVAFPLYQTPNALELAFLENGMRLTEGYKQVIVAPEGLAINSSFGQLEKLEVKRFAKHYFQGISGYNQLLLSTNFYHTFKQFDYLLIHQADVFLFKNELAAWCEKDYDYIGAPWFRPDKLNLKGTAKLLNEVKLFFKKNKVFASRHNRTGNGGFTLRKVETAVKVLATVDPSLLRRYTHQQGDAFNEDIFWSLVAPTLTDFKIPDWPEAMQFAVEFNPAIAYQYLNHQLPFGCHAPLKHDPQFWAQFIPGLR